MSNVLLDVKDLSVKVAGEEKIILHNINLKINKGETHVIMGPNGAGKSTLGSALLKDPQYEIINGKILFKNNDITDEDTDKIAKMGMYMTFQNPVEVPGITLANFIRTAIENKTGEHLKLWDFKKRLTDTMKLLDMDIKYADRDLNVGFSGGEKKKSEILQLLMLKPDFAILDETDSGLDVDATRTVSKGIREYKRTVGGSLMIITHVTRILEALTVDKTHVLVDGRLKKVGGRELVDEINENGFSKYEN